MISFDKFIMRSGMELSSYFFANNISSDDDLRDYCLANGFLPPEKSYFPKPALPEVEAVAKEAEVEVEKEQVKEAEPEEEPAPKPKRRTRTPRKRTSRSTKAKK